MINIDVEIDAEILIIIITCRKLFSLRNKKLINHNKQVVDKLEKLCNLRVKNRKIITKK